MLLFVATSLLLVASACFSGAEAALFTLASHQGRRRSVLVAKMIDNKVEVLSVILLANQVVNLSFFATTVAIVKPYSVTMGATINMVAVLAIVLFGEVAPKVLAHRYPDFFSRLSLPVVQLCWWLFAPIIKLFPNHKQDEPVSPTPLQSADAADILEGCEEVLDTQEETFLSRFLELGELRAGAMRRSMQDYLLLDRHLPLSLALRRMARARVPWAAVVDDHRQVIGVLDRTRLPQGRVVSDAMSTVPILPEVAPVAAGLKLLRDNGVPFILLVDEYGDSAGVIERGRWADTLLNRMPIAHTGLGKQVEEIADNRFLVDAAIALHEFADHFGEVQDGDVRVDTLAGYIQEKLGRIPAEGDEVPMATSTQKLMLKIASASETRILSIHLEVLT